MKIWFSFFGQTLNLLGYSRKKQGALENTFLKNPRMFLFLKFHVLFLWYPWKYHILSPTPLFVFFWDCPLNTEVMCIECLRHQWDTRESFYHQSSRFHQLIWERLQIFFHKFFWFTTWSFSDFEDFSAQYWWKEAGSDLHIPPPCYQDQSYQQFVTKYLKLTLAFMWNSTPWEKFNCYFLGLFY